MKKIIASFIFISCIGLGQAQTLEYAHNAIPVFDKNNAVLNSAFGGGINSGQFSSIDLNNDGRNDLMVFDRTSNKLSTFLKQNDKYQYAPQFESSFPENLINWVLLRDYNGDNKPDLFTSSSLGVKVYKNTSSVGITSWELVADPILTMGSSIINLFVNSSDLPAIVDYDEDGDLDILVFNFATGGFIEYHKNMSQENSNIGGLEFVRETRQWGDFQECLCGIFAYSGAPCFTNGKLEHVSGKAISLIDVDNDGQKELFFGEELCTDLFLLKNGGSIVNPRYRSEGPAFTSLSGKMSFPAVYHIEVTDDTTNEIIVSPNDRENIADFQDYSNSVYLFSKVGTSYQLLTTSFLQGDMIDIGENSAPTIGDLDSNGTNDLLIGKSGRLRQGIPASITLYDNKGSFASPLLQWQTDDFAKLSTLGLNNIKPKLVDLNADGQVDLVFLGSSSTAVQLYVIYGSQANFDAANVQIIDIRLNIGDNFELADVNTDGKLDLLIGTASGRLDLYINQGSQSGPIFQIATSSFQNITTNPSRTNLSIMEMSHGNKGDESLLLYDDSGELRLIKDYKIGVSEPTVVTINDSPANINIGKKGVLSGSSLLGPNSYQLLIGSTQGGIFAFSMEADGQSSKWNTIVYPNPSNDNFSVFSNQSASFDLIDLTGKMLLSNQKIKANVPSKIIITNYAKGMYLLRVTTEQNEKRVIRIVKNE